MTHELERSSTTEGLPVAPSLGPTLEAALVDRRVVLICGLAVLLALGVGGVAQALAALIAVCTNLAFYGRLSEQSVSPGEHDLGVFVIGVPVVGGLLVGLMARYGTQAIRGHGIPEAHSLIKRAAVVISEDCTLRDAADARAHKRLGRLPVLSKTGALVGIVTRSDLVQAHLGRLGDHEIAPPRKRRTA